LLTQRDFLSLQKNIFMNLQIKLFNFRGIPVHLSLWFLLLFFWMSPLITISVFISILLHEIGHAYTAQNRGYSVSGIEIGLFIGQANMDIDSIRERDMIPIVAAGPLVNLMLISLSVLAYLSFPNQFFNSMIIVNFFLFVFNIIPIFPLDGGRILRSILILNTKNREKSVQISAWISLLFSCMLVVFYLFSFSLIGIIFSILFVAYSMKELGWIKM
jgi:stage IV sporulation protein FB